MTERMEDGGATYGAAALPGEFAGSLGGGGDGVLQQLGQGAGGHQDFQGGFGGAAGASDVLAQDGGRFAGQVGEFAGTGDGGAGELVGQRRGRPAAMPASARHSMSRNT